MRRRQGSQERSRCRGKWSPWVTRGARGPGKASLGAGPTSSSSPERASQREAAWRARAPRPAGPAHCWAYTSDPVTPHDPDVPHRPARRPSRPAPLRPPGPGEPPRPGGRARSRRPARSAPAASAGAALPPPRASPSRVSRAREADADAARDWGELPRPASHSSAAAATAGKGRRQGGRRAARRASGPLRAEAASGRRPRPPGSSPRGSRWPALGGLAASARAGPRCWTRRPRGPGAAPRPRPLAPRAGREDGKFPWHLGAGGGWWGLSWPCAVCAAVAGTGALGWEGALVVVNSPGDRPLFGLACREARAVPVAELGRATHRGEEEPRESLPAAVTLNFTGQPGCATLQDSCAAAPFSFFSPSWQCESWKIILIPTPTPTPQPKPRARYPGWGWQVALHHHFFFFFFFFKYFLNWKSAFDGGKT